MISDDLKALPTVAALLERYPAALVDGIRERGEVSLFIDPAQLLPVSSYLKQERGFNRISGITAVDWHPIEPRFEVIYFFHSLPRNERLRIKCRADEHTEMDSLTELYAGANWYEREVWDLFGIRFRNHPDLTRIMMPDTWEGHPLRRDYPIHGHKYDYSSE